MANESSLRGTPVDNRGRYPKTPHPHFILKSPTHPLSLWSNMEKYQLPQTKSYLFGALKRGIVAVTSEPEKMTNGMYSIRVKPTWKVWSLFGVEVWRKKI